MKAELDRKRNTNEIWLLNKKEVQVVTELGRDKVSEMFQCRDFPAITIGQEYMVLNTALKEWLSQRRDILGK